MKAGAPRHRGRDLLVPPGEPQWIVGRLAYGVVDKDLEEQPVHLYALRDCKSWEPLGEATSSEGRGDVSHEGAPDDGGRVYFEIPLAKRLGVGRHRVRILVDGDGSFADLFVEVAPKDRAVFFSDVDGTLTLYESEEFTALVDGRLPSVHPDAPEVLRRIASRGALPLYVTARPEWLTDRTRALLDENGFPPGIVVTHPSTKGAVRRAAASFKRDVFARIEGRGYVPTWAFGNQPSDVEAYATTKVPPARRIFYQLDDVGPGARRIESYSDLLADPSL